MLIETTPRVEANVERPNGLDRIAAATGAALFGWVAWSVFSNIDQDAWIYFTYFKHFFERPFSFQPGHVTFGATSALHVIVMSPVFYLFGGSWLAVAKVLNFCLVLGGVALVHS